MSLTTVALTVYVLMWPVLVAIMMFIIGRGFYKDWKNARDRGVDIV